MLSAKKRERFTSVIWKALSLDDSSRYEGYCDGHIAGREAGRAEGEKIGIEKGEKQKALEIARSLKAAGKLSIEEIAEITKLPIEEIEKL